MKPKNVLLSTKQTAWEYLKNEHENPADVIPKEELDAIKKGHEAHYTALNHVRKVLETLGIPYQRVYQPYAAFDEFKDRDLIIAIGGDGTILNTAHFILDETPLLTVKSEPKSIGGLCMINYTEFEEAMKNILADKFKIEKWTRIEGKMGNKTDMALNEILIGPRYRSGAARYEIEFNGKKEAQLSSGIIISTGSGSSAWYSNIAGNEGLFQRESNELRFIATEYNAEKGYNLASGLFKPGATLKIKSLMSINGVASFDGDSNKRMYKFLTGNEIEISIAKKPLHVIKPI
ncbi:MAG: NAD(+)/NADH kinase [Nanoarchaeota archaeon]|nr:NAD(+)/NADH kinase [Nanoarchaeota archaeon]